MSDRGRRRVSLVPRLPRVHEAAGRPYLGDVRLGQRLSCGRGRLEVGPPGPMLISGVWLW